MRKFKNIARFVMELILTISIVTFILVYLISNTVLKEQYIITSLKKSDYYSKTYELMQSNFENYIQQSGLDEKILENIVTKEQIEEDTKKIIVNIYDGLNEKISTDKIKENLEKNINIQIDISSLNSNQKKAIYDFIEKICDEYKMTISNSNYESQINNVYKKINKYINIAKKAIIITAGVSIIVIILLNLRRNYKIGTNTGIAMLASGIILVIINIFINTKVKIQYLTILNEPISIVIRNIANSILSGVLKYGIILIIIGLISTVVSNFMHNVFKYKNIMEDKPEEI